ncbi:Hypothetical predicted protein [Xyrichtys novacula]|uniref:Secreted protein n=1 Tax=Xyrichtys novacula TaxID=13765 RepID=A0AAV1ENK3_XYRNO|nr:Hypothetical predicted protein [Xyrichtys novacula]
MLAIVTRSRVASDSNTWTHAFCSFFFFSSSPRPVGMKWPVFFLSGLPPRRPSFAHSRRGLLPISQQRSGCRRGRGLWGPSQSLLSSLSAVFSQTTDVWVSQGTLVGPALNRNRLCKPATSQNTELTRRGLAVI